MTANRIRVPVPAETSGEDRLVGSLTFRHAAYLAVGGAGVTLMVLGDRSAARISIGAIVALIGVVGAFCRPYGEPVERVAFTTIAFILRRRQERARDSHDAVVADLAATERAEAAIPPSEPLPERPTRFGLNPTVIRRGLLAAAVIGVAALAATRLADRPTPPVQQPQVVVVPVPVPAPNPWEELDRALNDWLNAVGG